MPWVKVLLHDGGFTYKWVEETVSAATATTTTAPRTSTATTTTAPRPTAISVNTAAAAAVALRARQIASQRAAIEAARERARNSAILAKRQAESRKRAAELLAFQKQQAEARRRAWLALREKQVAYVKRAGVVPGDVEPPPPPPPVRPLVSPSPGGNYDRQKLNTQQLAEQYVQRERKRQERLKREADEYAAELAYRHELDRLTGVAMKPIAPGVPVMVPDKTGIQSEKDAQSAESILAEELRRSQSGQAANPEKLRALYEQYDKYATQAYEKYKATAAQISALLSKAYDEKLTEAQQESALKRAKELYYGSDFTSQQAEFQRLFGDGTTQGSFSGFQRLSDQIAVAQREWWKGQLKSSLQNEINRLSEGGQRFDEDVSSEVSLLQKQLAIAQERPEALGRTIDHMETVIDEYGNKVTRPVYRTKTIEEALADQQAAIIAEQQKLWAQKQQQSRIAYLRQQNLMKTEGVIVGSDGQLRDPDEEKFRQQLIADARALWGTEMPSITRFEDQQRVANDLISKWESRNPAPRAGGKSPANQESWKAWKAKRDAYEQQVYKFLGGDGSPEWWERLMSVPGISHAVSAFQAGTSAIGAGGRVILKVTTGSSTFELSVPIDAFPEHIRSVARMALAPAPGDLSYERVDAVRALNEWLATPEGTAWSQKRKAEQAAQSQIEDSEFAEVFYGDGDIGQKLDALNKFGSQPFDDDASNLLFQLLVDPTNAIPLKFTTYLARAKYAADLAGGAAKLNPVTWGKYVKNFLTVDEGVLQLESKLAKYSDILKKSGKTPETAAEELRQLLAGTAEPSVAAKAFEEWARKVGLDPKQLAEGELFNISEWAATKAAGENGTLFTQQKKLAEEIKVREAAFKQRAKKRLDEQMKAKKALDAKIAQEADAARAATGRLAVEHAEIVRGLKEKADAAPSRAVAAPEAVGKSPAPAEPKPKPKRVRKPKEPKPVQVPVSEPGQLTEKLREVHAPVQARVRRSANYRAYESFDEYYVKDAAGNYIPKDRSITNDFVTTPEYKQLVKAAKAGDEGAKQQLAHQATIMRNRYRTVMQDAESVRLSKFTPSSVDVAESAGVLGDEAATAIVEANRAALRHMKRVAELGNADPYVSSMFQKSGWADEAPAQGRKRNLIGTGQGEAKAKAAPPSRIERGEAPAERGESVDIEDMAVNADRLDTGHDLIEARDQSLRGLHEVYDPFTHESSFYYTQGKGPLTQLFNNLLTGRWDETAKRYRTHAETMKLNTFALVMKQLDDLDDAYTVGGPLAAWRDGGQALFEIFHQMRLGRDFEKLRTFSSYVDGYLVEEPTSLFGWQWKVMEFRSGFDEALSEGEVIAGFKDAARANGLDPELALASIPWGYRGQRPPVSFALSPNLRVMEELDDWLPAPATWTEKNARDMVTHIFERNVGEPMQVIHYVARRFGDFVKGSPVMNRIVDELGHAGLKTVGIDEMVQAIARNLPTDSDLFRKMESRREALRVQLGVSATADLDAIIARRPDLKHHRIEDVIREGLTKKQARTPRGSFLRPEYPDLRIAIWRAYWAGDLPFTNARAHELLYLTHLQNTGLRDAMLSQTRQFMRYMRDIGQEDEARRFLQRIHSKEFGNLGARWRAEHVSGVGVKDPITGNESFVVDSPEWQMWRDMGFVPKDTSEADALIAKNRRDIEEAEEMEARNADYVAHERDTPSNAYTGVVGDEQMDDLVSKIETAKDANQMRGPLTSVIRRIADSGGLLMAAEAEAQIASVIKAVREMPGGLSVLRNIQDEIGEGLLAERVAGSGERLAFAEATLRLRLRAMEDATGKVRPSFQRAHTQLQLELERLLGMKQKKPKSHRVNLDELREAYEKSVDPDAVKAAGDAGGTTAPKIKIEPVEAPPRVKAARAGQQGLLEKLLGMTEEEWWHYAREESRRILRSKMATAQRKAEARQRIADIELAEYARRVDKERGSFVSWEARADHRDRVLAHHGKDAEQYFRANMIAPYARDIYGATVEQVRTWHSQIRRAPAENAPSKVGSLGKKFRDLDYFPIEQFDEVEQAVSQAIREARGWTAETLTRARGSRKELKTILDDEMGASRLVDKDPVVIAAKKRVLDKYGIDINAYDEARKVLWKGYVQRRTNQWLIDRTNKVVEAAKGLGVKDPSWDKAYHSIRDKMARQEARRQLAALSFGEMFGAPPQAVMNEFAARYGFDGTLRDVRPRLSAFQRKTLEQAVSVRSGGADLKMFLQSANRPPFEQGREAVREHLKRTGAWSPRKAEDFTLGKASWSIKDEAEYWDTNFGFTPPWTDPSKLRGEFNAIFHDPELYYLQMQQWGIFNRSMDLKLKLDGTSAKAIEQARIHGDPAQGIPGRRELAEQRRYVVERYGDLVGKIGSDGEAVLTAMPWLMYPDEKLRYLAKYAADGLPEGLIQTADELKTVLAMVEKHMKPLMDELIAEKAGAPIMYEDIYRVASRVQAELLSDPFWRKRMRDRLVGDPLAMWTKFNRWMIFSNPSFGIMNIIDVPIKTAWYRGTRRGLFNPGLHGIPEDVLRRAQEMTPAHLGLDAQTTIYYRKQRSAAEYFTDPRKEIRIGPVNVISKPVVELIESIEGAAHVIPEAAGSMELRGKMHLARGMYPQVYARALQRLGDPDLADVWAKNFIKEEIGRMWPVAGDGPLEKLFNRLVPFGSYMVRNKVLFLSEAVAHPTIINKIEAIGRAIESYNLREWEKDHPDGEIMPEYLRRQIELPWAPGYYLDLGQFSDATRGLKPLYTLGDEKTVLTALSEWVRLINPSSQALLYMVTNAIGLTKRIRYVPILDENGFPTGQYEEVVTGWTEPWSKDQPDLGSVFWLIDALKSFEALGPSPSAGQLSQFLGQVMLFNAISTYDRGTAMFAAYKLMLQQDKEAAERWLQSPKGDYLRDWLVAHANSPREVKNILLDIARGQAAAKWADWFALTPGDRRAIVAARDRISQIRDFYAVKLSLLTPGTDAYRKMKAQMYYAINEVYLATPALMKEEVWSKTAAEWADKTADWQTDKLMDDFMALSAQRPARSDYATSKEYRQAVVTWEASKRLFLNTYPEVQKRLSSGIAALDAVREQQNAEWSAVLDRVAARNGVIEDAKAIIAAAGRDSAVGQAAQDRLDLLYLQNDLDYSLLNRDYAATYFAPEDFERLPFGKEGPENLRSGITLPRVNLLNDFSTARYEKALREGRLDDFLAAEQYGKDMKAAILHSKGGDPFGEFNPAKFYKYMQDHPALMDKYFAGNPAKKKQWAESAAYVSGIKAAIRAANASGKFDPSAFVSYLKSHPSLLAAYFERHPEKKAQWAKTDAYIKHISVWGKLVSVGRWDEAKDVWDKLPQWVKDEYYAKHPEKRAQAAKTAEYLGFMKTWVSYFDKGDKQGAMDYFNKLPKWAKERYYAAHPDKRVKYETSAKMFDKLKNYFAADPENQSLYLANNPDLARWLAQNATDSDKVRFAILAAYQAIPKDEAWLRRVFREKYPEIFSAEALGERKLRRVAATLADRPEMSESFEHWVKAVMDSYYEMLRLGKPRPLNSFITFDRKVPERAFRHRSRSAEESSQK